MHQKRNAAVSMLAAAAFIGIAGIYSRSLWISFVFVMLHEAVHVAVSCLLGYRAGGLKILPFGTMAVLKDEFIRPVDDVIISLSGPLINFIFFCVFDFLSLNAHNLPHPLELSWAELARINLALCLFNLMPGEFLDGGRILKVIFKLHTCFLWSYAAAFLGGIVTGAILVSGLIYYKLTINGIIIFSLGVYIIVVTVYNMKDITLGVIKDEFYKQSYADCMNMVRITTIGVSKDVKIVDVIKHFCFNRYYKVCLIEKGEIKGIINEKQLYNLYCSYGNITISECITHIKTQEV